MIRKIPENLLPTQPNSGDVIGDFWASYNIDMTSMLGKIRISPKLQVSTSSDVDADMLHPMAFVRNKAGSLSVDTYFAVCSGSIFYTPVSNIAFIQDTLPNTPTSTLSNVYSDAVSFNGSLIVSTLTDLAKLTAGTWTASWYQSTLGIGAGLTTGIPHPLCVGFNNLLLIGNGNVVASVTTAPVANSARLTLPVEYEVIWIRSSNTAYWIGARHKFGGKAKVFMWNGADDNFTQDYVCGSSNTMAGVIKDEVCYTINGNGQLMAFNGGGFIEVARFPIAEHKTSIFNDGFSSDYEAAVNVSRNGMTLLDNKINILVSAGINNNNHEFLENFVGGIWEYLPGVGLYHKYPIVKGNDGALRDYGSPIIDHAGALIETNKFQGSFLAGAVVSKDGSGTDMSVINVIGTDNRTKIGYFITPKIYGNSIEEMWQKAFLNYSTLLTSGDSISLKYRTSVNYTPTYTGIGTWSSTTVINVDASFFGDLFTDWSADTDGYEIELLSGEGSGLSAQINNMAAGGVGGTYDITIDTAVPSASGTVRIRTSNWTKLDSVTDLITQNKEIALPGNSNWIQFKVLMYSTSGGDSPELEKVTVVSTPHLKPI